MPFPATNEKDVLHVSPQNMIHTGIRGLYSDSSVNTDLDLGIDVTILQRVVIHNSDATVCRVSACMLVIALQDSSSRSGWSYCL